MYFWAAREVHGEGGAASKSHDWQVLSPVRVGLAGADALNLSIQGRFRTRVRAMAESNHWWAKLPKPAGPQWLLWGDKVINVQNNGKRFTYPAQDKAYVANGDIGVIVGGYKTKTMKRRPTQHRGRIPEPARREIHLSRVGVSWRRRVAGT